MYLVQLHDHALFDKLRSTNYKILFYFYLIESLSGSLSPPFPPPLPHFCAGLVLNIISVHLRLEPHVSKI
jgi:hypothetical protein